MCVGVRVCVYTRRTDSCIQTSLSATGQTAHAQKQMPPISRQQCLTSISSKENREFVYPTKLKIIQHV